MQVIPNILPIVRKLTPFLRSPISVATGSGAQHAGQMERFYTYSEGQRRKFVEDLDGFDYYVRV